MPLELEAGETLLRAEEMQVVPDGGAPHPAHLWLTTRRLVVRWNRSGGLLRPEQAREITLRLQEVAETRTPGGPLVQVIGQDGTRLSLQTFRPIPLHEAIRAAVWQVRAVPEGATPLPGDRSQSADTVETSATARPPVATAGAEIGTAACSRCGGDVPNGARFCPHCGRYRRSDAAYCRRCDEDYPARYRYCARCGEALAGPEP